MIINNPVSTAIVVAATGEVLRWKLVPIGVWNMDAVPSVNIAHGLTNTNIVGFKALIFSDNYAEVTPIDFGGDDGNISGAISMLAVTIKLQRYDLQYFTLGGYNSAVINRGYVYIVYKD